MSLFPQIQELLEQEINPILALHSGECVIISFSEESKTLKIALRGGCVGCPSSKLTLYNGVIPIFEASFPDLQILIEEEI